MKCQQVSHGVIKPSSTACDVKNLFDYLIDEVFADVSVFVVSIANIIMIMDAF